MTSIPYAIDKSKLIERIAQLIVNARDRTEALARMRRALSEFKIGPGKTTIPLHLRLLQERQFVDMDVDIYYVERLLEADSSDD